MHRLTENHALLLAAVLIVIVLVCGFVLLSTAEAGTGYLKSQRISGLNRICIYNHLGSDVAITIKSTELCPLSIKVP